jgi:membrane-associated phospholipid phosphatase
MAEEPIAGTDPKETSDAAVAELIVSAPRAAARARWAEIVFLVALCAYSVLAVLAHRNAYFGWDLSLARFIQSISAPGFHTAMVGVSILGNGVVPWVLIVGTGLVLIRAGLRIEGLVCLAGSTLGWLVNQSWKLLIARPRPSDSLVDVAGVFHFKSFPSGHVFFFAEFFGFMLFLAHVLLRRGRLRDVLRILLSLLILSVGASRVYLGAHWPSDAVGAYLAGGLWLMIMIEVYRRMKEKQESNKRLRQSE